MRRKGQDTPDFLLLASAANETVSSLARALEKDEIWLTRVLVGQKTCTAEEAAAIVELVGVDPEWASYLVSRPEIKPRRWADILDKFFDKVVLGVIALAITLLIQYQFNSFTLNRERAVAVSNFRSEFLLDRYAQARNNFVNLLTKLEQARRDYIQDPNSPTSLGRPSELQSLITQIDVEIGIIASAHPSTKNSAESLTRAMHTATSELLDRSIPEDFQHKVDMFRGSFFDFGGTCQQALVQTVETELEAVQKRTSLWR